MLRCLMVCAGLLALTFPAALAANGGQGSHVVLTPAQPIAGQPVTFSWSGTGDYVTIAIGCDDATGYNGTLRDDGIDETFTTTFPNATACGDQPVSYAYANIYTRSGNSQGYQLKVAYFSFTVAL